MKRAPHTPSKISVPPHAHPHARLVFELMVNTGTTYAQVEERAGILRTTLKSYRCEKTPSLHSIEALLGSFGWLLIPTPPLDSLPAEVREKLEEISLHFRSDDEVLAAAIATFAKRAGEGKEDAEPIAHSFRDFAWAA